jgi:ubiquinone/menaquinone biosynthesis C-methylase UbiE
MGHAVYGIDYAKEMLNRAIRRNKEINYAASDIYFLPYKNFSFDVVMIIECLQSISDEKRALRESARTLVQEGVVLFIETRYFLN